MDVVRVEQNRMDTRHDRTNMHCINASCSPYVRTVFLNKAPAHYTHPLNVFAPATIIPLKIFRPRRQGNGTRARAHTYTINAPYRIRTRSRTLQEGNTMQGTPATCVMRSRKQSPGLGTFG